jgi:hypothetical protein
MEYDYTLAGPGAFLIGTTEVSNTATIDSDPTAPLSTTETIQVEQLPPIGGVTMPVNASTSPGLLHSELAVGWILLAAMIAMGAIATASFKQRAA